VAALWAEPSGVVEAALAADRSTEPATHTVVAEPDAAAPPTAQVSGVPGPVPPRTAPDAPPRIGAGGLPPDPAAYDSARNAAARARGLPLPYIPGGNDPDPAAGAAEERHYVRLLLLMVGAIVLGGFVLGILGWLVANALGL
jgi:hypothetical protein